jgi:serine protease Do
MSTPALLPPTAPLPSVTVDDAAHALATRLRRSILAVAHNTGAGSGTPWPGGFVVTNNHVVPGDAAIVSTSAGKRIEARVIAREPSADLVLLDARLPGIEPLPVRLDPPLHAGELVYAIGNPWGERGVLTAGVVLAAGGGRLANGNIAPVRADLRLAPGNSGGPMVDAEGQIVGINSMIIGGVAIAIPASVVDEFVRTATADRDASYHR